MDCDIVIDITKTDAADVSYTSNNEFMLFNSFGNLVYIYYRARSLNSAHYMGVAKFINSSWTNLYEGLLGVVATRYMRIKRRTTSGPSNNYFDFYHSVDGVSWVGVYSAQIRDATLFNETHALQPLPEFYSTASADVFDPQITRFYQYTGDMAVQRYYKGSPYGNIIDSAAGAVVYAYDAGVGKTWTLSGAAATISEPSGSSVKFKLGWSNDGSTVTWVDGTWQTIAQVDTNAAGGSYDGHRYIHVMFQENSDGTSQPM